MHVLITALASAPATAVSLQLAIVHMQPFISWLDDTISHELGFGKPTGQIVAQSRQIFRVHKQPLTFSVTCTRPSRQSTGSAGLQLEGHLGTVVSLSARTVVVERQRESVHGQPSIVCVTVSRPFGHDD